MMLHRYMHMVWMIIFSLQGAAQEQLTLSDCFRHKHVSGVRANRHYVTFVTQVQTLAVKRFAGVACIVEGCNAECVQKIADVYKTSLARNSVSITDDLKYFNECIFEDACAHVLKAYKRAYRAKLRKNMRVQTVWFAEFKQKGVVHEFGDPAIKPDDAAPMRKFIWPVTVEKQLAYRGLQEGPYYAPMLRFDADRIAIMLNKFILARESRDVK